MWDLLKESVAFVVVVLSCVLALALFMGSPNANALTPGETVVLKWDTPMERVDGSPVTVDQLDYYTIICNGYNTGNAESILTLPVDADQDTQEVKRTELFMSYGDYKCQIKVTAKDGTDGEWSEYVRVNWDAGEPNPAKNVMIVNDD
jgi:hypothetical protein